MRAQKALGLALAVAGGVWLSVSIAWTPPLTLFIVRYSAVHQMPPPLAWAVDLAAPAALLGAGIRMLRRPRPNSLP